MIIDAILLNLKQNFDIRCILSHVLRYTIDEPEKFN